MSYDIQIDDLWEYNPSQWQDVSVPLSSIEAALKFGNEVFQITKIAGYDVTAICMKSTGPFIVGNIYILSADCATSKAWRLIFRNQSQGKNQNTNGAKCLICKDYSPYAVPNQPDGSFKCWSCRHI